MRIDFARIDLVGVDFVRVDLVAPNPFRKPLFQAFTNSVHKTIHCRAHGCLRVMGLER